MTDCTLHPPLPLSLRIRPAEGFPMLTERDRVIKFIYAAEEAHASDLELVLSRFTRKPGHELDGDEAYLYFGNLAEIAHNARRLARRLREVEASGRDRISTLFLCDVRPSAER